MTESIEQIAKRLIEKIDSGQGSLAARLGVHASVAGQTRNERSATLHFFWTR